MIAWWKKREENEVAWRVKVGDLKRGFDLDVKNPIASVAESDLSVNDCLKQLRTSVARLGKALAAVEAEYRP
jgi:type I restriction enzyme M protein